MRMRCCWKFVIGCRIVNGTNRGFDDPQTIYMVGEDFIACYEQASKRARDVVTEKSNSTVDTYLKFAEQMAENIHVL